MEYKALILAGSGWEQQPQHILRTRIQTLNILLIILCQSPSWNDFNHLPI